MSQIIKAFTGVFFVLLMMVSAVGLLGAFLQAVHAQNLHSAFICELENSDYARPVLEECFIVSEEAGYDLQITLYFQNSGMLVCDTVSSLPQNCEGIHMAEVELTYPLQISFFNIDMEQVLFGYAR